MPQTHPPTPDLRKPLRLWPGVVVAVLLLLVLTVVPVVVPDGAIIGVLGGAIGGLLILLWWLFFSRALWLDRLGAIVVMVLAVVVSYAIVHPSISGAMMGRMLPMFSLPLFGLALVASAVLGRRLSASSRRALMVIALVLACATLAFVRTGGVTGAGASQFHWRWTPTPEERLLAQEPVPGIPAPAAVAAGKPVVPTATSQPAPSRGAPASRTERPAALESGKRDPGVTRIVWPGFRGPNRDDVVRGARIETDWAASPPAELWRRAIGPGWSSFAVSGELIYTQEQRGEFELVSCYRLRTGKPVWTHRDPVRFYESNGGPGPRATPVIHEGRVYSMGATGIVNALHAGNGAVLWSRNAQSDTGAPMPGWGFAGSPIVVNDLLIVAASGRLVAYDLATGDPRWTRATGGGGYSSPHVATIGGVRQIILLSGGGVTGLAVSDGAVLWQHNVGDNVGIIQPAVIGGGGVLVSGGDAMGGIGIRRLAVTHDGSGWKVEERWTTRGLKPYFSDFVVHEGHAYGFDGTIMAAIDVADGERVWKGGRYGAGQVLLLPDQDLLLVLSEEGELVLVQATPEKHTELARFTAIEGKTWNHPVLAGEVLLVRNGQEMAAFRIRPGDR